MLAEFNSAIKSRPELGTQNLNRIHNMKHACKTLDLMQIECDRIFSVAYWIGNPDNQEIFLAGPVILNGKLSSARGGGLCQITTTIFNAARSAQMNIIERHGHSTDIWGESRLVPIGQDATFAFGYKDFKFRNGRSSSCVLRLFLNDAETSLTAQIWSSND